jgi:hypothetical protein
MGGLKVDGEELGVMAREQVSLLGNKQWPGIWAAVDAIREMRSANTPFPDWVFLTQAETSEILQAIFNRPVNEMPDSMFVDLVLIQVLSAWRATQGVYVFDDSVYGTIAETEMRGSLPTELLKHMPEWAVLVSSPGLTFLGDPVDGFFACLDFDLRSSTPLLTLLTLNSARYEATQIRLTQGRSLQECIEDTRDFMSKSEHSSDGFAFDEAFVRHAVNLLLFVCSQCDQVGDLNHRPTKPIARRTKKGKRMFPPDCPTIWGVGVRMGASLKAALRDNQSSTPADTNEGSAKRPHIRRAHWHGYWMGPFGGERRFDLRWMPPLAVNVLDQDQITATVRSVC